jgi:hypothetical protein
MPDVRRADQVDPEHAIPRRRVDLPEREAELARADPRCEDDVVARADGLGRPGDRGVVGDVGDDRGGVATERAGDRR